MKRYPLLFSLHELVEGEGWIASVHFAGRVLAEDERDTGDGWWMQGVNPGAIVQGGETLFEAFARYRDTLRRYLKDVAIDAMSFEGFREEIIRFFHECDSDTERAWDEAVREIRAGKPAPAEIPHRQPAESPRAVEVRRIERPSAGSNVAEDNAVLAA